MDGRGEEEFGERWWLREDAEVLAEKSEPEPELPPENVDASAGSSMALEQDETDLTDPNALRPAHVPNRAAVEVDRRRLDSVPTVFESETKRKNTFTLAAVGIAIVVALILAFMD